jgi:5-methylcytosine-specific restriction endonuclease McrA
MPRREFPRKVKAAAIKRAAGHCERCKAVLKSGEADVDHVLEDALGGEPVLANAQVLCKPCHKEKTADRVRKIRKADRSRDKASGAIRPKQTIKSAPFPSTPKSPRIDKSAIPPLPRAQIYRSAS